MPLTEISEPSLSVEKAAKLDFLWLELTQKCNLSCRHCYVSSGPDKALHDHMTHENWLEVIATAGNLQCKSVQFIGGEPLLYPNIEDLIHVARDKGFDLIEVFTNGTPVTDQRAEQFSRWNVRVACSVYSDNPAVHDKITRMPGSFEKTIDALRRLADRCVPVRVGFIEMDANAGDFERTRELLSKLGITSVGHDNIRSFGRGSWESAQSSRLNSFDGLCGQCSRGRICVTYSGEAFPCIMSRAFPIGNVLESGLAEVVAGRKLSKFRREMNESFGLDGAYATTSECRPTIEPCMVCGPGSCTPDRNPCVPDVPICGPAGPT